MSITALDPAVRARTVDVIRRLIALCHDLGGTMIVHGSPAQRRLEPGHEAESYRYGVECWAAIAKDAEAAGITYCIEPLHQPDANFVNTVEEAAAIVRQIDSPAVRTMIDCSAATIWEKQPVPDLIRQWMPTGLIAHIHFNDPNRRGPGDGTLAFGPILTALRETGYTGNAAHRAVHLHPRRRDLRRAQHWLHTRGHGRPGVDAKRPAGFRPSFSSHLTRPADAAWEPCRLVAAARLPTGTDPRHLLPTQKER